MRIETIEVENFRGIAKTRLERCGALNVLIGRNNSGKSTMLDAIDAFFGVLAGRDVISLDPAIGRPIDFHRGTETSPIAIRVHSSLTADELHDIADLIVADAPQMKHALEDLNDEYRLSTAVLFPPGDSPLGYVAELGLVRTKPTVQKRLLSINFEAATELRARGIEARRARRTAAQLRELALRFDPDDFQRMRADSERMRRMSSARQFARLGPELNFEIERLVYQSDNYGEFRERLDTMVRAGLEAADSGPAEPLKSTVKTFAGDGHDVPNYITQLLGTLAGHSLLHLRDRREPVGREEAKRLLGLKVRRGGPEVLRNIQETVQALLGVNIDAFESQTPSPAGTTEPRAEMDVDEFLVEVNGAGVREALRLILDNELSAPDILLVEEPEVHLHPALELSMMRYLKAASNRTQIFVTTHSTNFLDTADMRNVYLVTKHDDTSIKLVDYEEAQEAIPAELGIRLSSLFMFDRLVFVEGPSDEAVIRELASLCGINFGQTNVGFVAMGGARNFTHYATESMVSFLTHRQVSLTFLLDRDEASDTEVASLIERFNGRATMHVLEKRELENYLLVPRALAEFIRLKQAMTGHDGMEPDPVTVDAALGSCADELRPTAIARRVARTLCVPAYPSRERVLSDVSEAALIQAVREEMDTIVKEAEGRAATAERLIEEETKNLSSGWEQKRLSVVPGDELLDCVCRRFGVRFKKERDGARLAGLLRPEEIPTELRKFLTVVTS